MLYTGSIFVASSELTRESLLFSLPKFQSGNRCQDFGDRPIDVPVAVFVVQADATAILKSLSGLVIRSHPRGRDEDNDAWTM
jgi:hypothetical protein